MYQTKNLGLNITEIEKDTLSAFNFDTDLGDNFKAIDEKTLSHRNITNCILEVPQSIKAVLFQRQITINSGSRIIIPYGIEDKTNEFPIGAIFLNDNFIVTNTFFTEGKFFVEAEIQQDLVHEGQGASTEEGSIFVHPKTNWATDWGTRGAISGTTPPTQHGFFYNTDTNVISWYVDGVISYSNFSFPLMLFAKESGFPVEINQVFNGFGYIGSTVFALPGVKGLVPNGRNEDGSINNIKQTLENVFIRSFTESSVSGDYITSLVDNFGGGLTGLELKTKVQTFYQNKKPDSNNTWWFDTEEIQWKYVETDSTITRRWWLDFGVCNVSNGIITSLTVKKPFRAVDYYDYQTKITELETKIATLQAAVEALQGS